MEIQEKMQNEDYVQSLIKNDIPMVSYYTEQFLKRIDPLELAKRIKRFNKLDFRKMSEMEIIKEVESVMRFENIVSIMNAYSVYRKGTRFYRVRKLNNLNVPNDSLTIKSDFWNPPSRFVKKYGRLNKPKESLLYTAFNPLICIKETNIMNNEPFAIIVYEAKREVRFSWIGSETNYRHHNISDFNAILVHEIYKNFLINQFTKEVPPGQEYLYRISEHIAKDYFLADTLDGWRYPSMKDKSQYNFCFRTEVIQDSLSLLGALVGTYSTDETFTLEYIAHGFDKDGRAIIHENANCTMLREKLFPEFHFEADLFT